MDVFSFTLMQAPNFVRCYSKSVKLHCNHVNERRLRFSFRVFVTVIVLMFLSIIANMIFTRNNNSLKKCISQYFNL